MKKCFKCGEIRPLKDFYRHAQMADGRVNKCKTCNLKDVRKHREENVEKIREYDRARSKTAKRRKHLDENCRKYRKANPEKYRAHSAVAHAVDSGALKKKNCEICNTDYSVHAHHDDYSKPLEVIWLCALHHAARHKKLRLG